MSIPKTLRCAVYTRKSTEEGLEQAFNSLDAQREACEAYVMSQTHEGWICLTSRYDDGGFTGGNMERPGLQALMRDIDRGLVDVVVVYKVDRLTRALADFAKIVERFDKRGVSFVSVTQAFNTTSSMGRLTLNVLLSFAQFEREVTSERIRDKLAASRRKGMWMGGKAPFGYVVREKKIYPDPIEAPIVGRIYARYLDLKSVRLLRDELEAEGVISKAYVSRHGRAYGGKAFDRGALYHLLQNRLYVGEIRHKAERHNGQHEAVVPTELFDAVQAQLAETRRREPGPARASVKHPLTGLLWDDQGNRMSPTHGRSRGQRYRYYVSQSRLGGKRTSTAAIDRIPAEPIEELVRDRVLRLIGAAPRHDEASTTAAILPGTPDLVRTLVDRVVIGRDTITLRLHREQLDIKLAELTADQRTDKIPTIDALQRRLDSADQLITSENHLELVVAGRPIRRGAVPVIERPDGAAATGKPRHDQTLLKAIARAHGWLDLMLSGKAPTIKAIARHEGIEDSFISRTIQLAFLPPDHLAQIFAGRQPAASSVDRLTRDSFPLSWR
jgi:DNA invertase Pin-like site-specific DNA recombinase